MRSESTRSTSLPVELLGAERDDVCPRATPPATPRRSSRASIVSTSLMRGTLRTTTSCSVSREAASAGNAPFLLPAGTTVPESGRPPSMTNFSTGPRVPRRSARFFSVQPTRQEAWELVEEWVGSDSLRKHLLGVEAAMVGYARRWGEDEEMYAVTGLLHDLDYDRYPDLETGHPRHALKLFEEKGYPQELIDAVAGHATFLGVPRETKLAKTLYAVDELSGFVAACALVRPTGIHGLTPKSVKKKLKQPSFAAGVNRDEVREGAEDLGVEFDEHVAFVIAAMEERADELGLSKMRAGLGSRRRASRCALPVRLEEPVQHDEIAARQRPPHGRGNGR